jgi:hypothetical protein
MYAFVILVGKVKKRDLENEAVNEGTVQKPQRNGVLRWDVDCVGLE